MDKTSVKCYSWRKEECTKYKLCCCSDTGVCINYSYYGDNRGWLAEGHVTFNGTYCGKIVTFKVYDFENIMKEIIREEDNENKLL